MTSVSPSDSVAARLHCIHQTLPSQVRLVAVTKQVSVDMMRQAYQAGIRDFGENRVQEAIQKRAQIQDVPDLTWHLIGHLQRNKVKAALETFDWIHSVDSLALAQRLDQVAATLGKHPQICLQVKLAPDPHKFGWTAADLKRDFPALKQCHHLQLRGLMTILPLGLTPPQALAVFQQTQALAQELQRTLAQDLAFTELSMGMSDDYPLAVQAGATMVRLGRILFGDLA